MWDVLSRVTKTAWDVMSGVTKTAWDVMSGRQKQHGMFCPGWQIFVGCFVRGGKKWHGMFCPGMFCPAPRLTTVKYMYANKFSEYLW